MTSPNQPFDKRQLLKGGLLILLVVLAYLPAFHGQFLWDDDDNIINNQTLRSVDGLRRIWLEPGATQQYYPLTHTTFWLDYHLWGKNTVGYHALNILLHAASTLFLWMLLQRLAVPGAWLGAALFGLHPVCVESVAWITERKNTLSGVFFIGALIWSVKFWLPRTAPAKGNKQNQHTTSAFNNGAWKYYWLALLFYVCALCSKTAAVGLPAVIVFLLWWQRRKFEWRNVALLAPFLVAGIAMGLVTMWVEKHHVGAAGHDWHFSWPERFLIAGRAIWFYLGKLALPFPLTFMYPRWDIKSADVLAWLPLLAVSVIVVILWLRRDRWGRPILFACACFIAMLAPVLGFFDVFFFRYSFVNDHFQYLACIAPLALAGAGITIGIQRFRQKPEHLLETVGGAFLLVLAVLTWRQTYVYRDVETLWRDTIAHNPQSWMAHNNLGNSFLEQGKFQEATEQYGLALSLKPDFASALNNQGSILLQQGKITEAKVQISRALELEPDSPSARYNLALVFDAGGKLDDAERQYEELLKLKPDYAAAHNNLGNLLFRKGRMDAAISHFETALKLDADYALAHNNLGRALASKGDLAEATRHFALALQLDPNLADARYAIGAVSSAKGDLDEAIRQFQEVLRLRPDHAQAHKSLANALVRKGRFDEAAWHYRSALQLQPNFADAHYNLGVILARQGKLDEAREQFAEAVKVKPDYAEAVKQLKALTPAP